MPESRGTHRTTAAGAAAAERAERRRQRSRRKQQPERWASEPGSRSGSRAESRAESPAESPAASRPARRPVRPSRRRVLVRRWVAVLVLIGVVVLGLSLWFTPLLGVRAVAVTGTKALSTDQVVAAADINLGTPMLRVSTSDIARRVATLPRVSVADVSRGWPWTIRIEVTERTATAVLYAPDGVHLVDSTGFDFATVPTAPAGLPKLTLPAASPADARTRAVETVLAALPSQLRGQVASIGADTPASVRFQLTNGKAVMWGDATDSGRKAEVLAALLTRPGNVYDVSSPTLPTVS